MAKESADVIIMDDNFSTIVTVGKWGRSIYINIQKFVQFQLTVNIVALIVNFSSACLTGIWALMLALAHSVFIILNFCFACYSSSPLFFGLMCGLRKCSPDRGSASVGQHDYGYTGSTCTGY